MLKAEEESMCIQKIDEILERDAEEQNNFDECEDIEMGESTNSNDEVILSHHLVANATGSCSDGNPTVAGEADAATTSAEDDLMADNVQSFINMGVLQAKYNINDMIPIDLPPRINVKRN
jgi:hypothetical protein